MDCISSEILETYETAVQARPLCEAEPGVPSPVVPAEVPLVDCWRTAAAG